MQGGRASEWLQREAVHTPQHVPAELTCCDPAAGHVGLFPFDLDSIAEILTVGGLSHDGLHEVADSASAKGVLFIALEDETGVANPVIWPKIFEQNRRTVLGSRMLRVDGRIQRESDVVHLVALLLCDLSARLQAVAIGTLRRGDDGHHGGSGVDSRSKPTATVKPRDTYIPDRSLEAIRLRSRDFS